MAVASALYENVLVHYRLDESEMKEECTDDVLLAVAKRMTRWRSIDLGLGRAAMREIDDEPCTEEGKRFEYMRRWKEMFGHKATCEQLVLSFIKAGRADLAETVCERVKAKVAGIVSRLTVMASENITESASRLVVTPSDGVFPECMTLISRLFGCSMRGVTFRAKEHDFGLIIPEGAIPAEESLTIDIGVALHGPFQFPDTLRPVSPVFWVCVHGHTDFKFLKPVTVTIPHFLELEKDADVDSLGVTFLKADREMNLQQMFQFKHTNGLQSFETFKQFGMLHTTHFCSFCIACRERPECLKKARFCITALLPRSATPVGKRKDAYFFITFSNLTTYLKKVDELIEVKNLEGYRKHHDEFQFKHSRKPALEMIITQPQRGKVGVEGKTKIFRDDIDFIVRETTSDEDLQYRKCGDFYPPRFRVFLTSTPENPTMIGAKIKFKGSASDIEYDMFLEFQDPEKVPNDAPACKLHKFMCVV
jgi:hypothetical protein